MNHRTELTPLQKYVLAQLRGGVGRAAIARARGISKARMTQIAAAIEKKGFGVPRHIPTSPAVDRARPMFAAGATRRQVADALGVSYQRAKQLEKRCLATPETTP
jgi:DNA-binding CsgD family transcriptional regulator